jgi:hypothetical protein
MDGGSAENAGAVFGELAARSAKHFQSSLLNRIQKLQRRTVGLFWRRSHFCTVERLVFK